MCTLQGGGARSLTCQVHLLKLPCDLWPLVDPWPWWMTLTSGEWPWPLTLTFDLGTQFELCFFDNDKCRSDTSYRILNFYIWPFMFDLWLTFDLGEWPWPLMHDLDPWPWNLTLAQNLNYLFTILKYVKLAQDIRDWQLDQYWDLQYLWQIEVPFGSGDILNIEIERAIKGSRRYIVVTSPDYLYDDARQVELRMIQDWITFCKIPSKDVILMLEATRCRPRPIRLLDCKLITCTRNRKLPEVHFRKWATSVKPLESTITLSVNGQLWDIKDYMFFIFKHVIFVCFVLTIFQVLPSSIVFCVILVSAFIIK